MLRQLAIAMAAAALAACAPALPPADVDEAVLASGQLFKPDGVGPFPAVIVLHGCSGLTPNHTRWAHRLTAWGYAAFVIDSFGPRGVQTVCDTPNVPPLVRARDALNAAIWLRAQPEIDGDRIGVVGFSHGGSTVMQVIRAPVVQTIGAPPFRAAVAYYPGCPPSDAPLATDVLILIGDADDWSSANRCARYVESTPAQAHTVELKRYPGAYHAFDAPAGRRSYLGHTLGYDAAAAEDSFERTRAFFDAHLRATATDATR